jgi:hypothetical protein
MCRQCWYSGAVLERNLRGVINVLESITQSVWKAEHTGGGCFWLATPPFSDDDLPYAHMIVTAWPDVLGGGDTVSGVEEDGGWLLTASPQSYPDEEDTPRRRNWPSDGYDRGLGTEELPIAALEALEWLRSLGVDLSAMQ